MLCIMRTLLAMLVLAACGPAATPVPPHQPPPPPPPPAPVDAAPHVPVVRTVDVVDHEHGIESHDPYRWMEGTDNAELTSWLRAQGETAARDLGKLPGRDKLRARVRELGLGVTAVFDVQLGGDRTFYKVLRAEAQLADLAVRDAKGEERVLVSPEKLSAEGTHFSLNAYSASLDGKLIAYVLSQGGGERGTLHVMDVATGKDLPDQIERIWGEGAASWLTDGSGFFYTQLAAPQPGVDPMQNQTARLHRLGKPVADDATILGRDPTASMKLAPEEWPGLWSPPGTSWVLAFVGGAHSEQRVAFAKLADVLAKQDKTVWREFSGYSDGVEGVVVHGDRLYFSSYKDAPNRRLLSVPLAKPELAGARVEIAEEGDAPLVSWNSARDAVYLVHRVNGRARLSRWAWGGKATPIALPQEGWIPDVASDLRRDGLVFQLETWLAPGAYYAYDAKRGKLAPTGLASKSNADFSAITVDEVDASSADGTKVPLSIFHAKKLALDGTHPTILYGYGAYGSSQSPGFNATRLAWIEQGGVYAIAHVRGGGERGRRWQDDGSLDKKMNGIGDFIACGQYLVDHQYTSPARLGAVGVSMGGILVGRSLTERPDLFAAVHVGSGFVNPVRLLAAENGANQKVELGDPATEDGYRALYAMDPYQHIAPNAAYPAVIFTVGLNDHRVPPWMSGKMAARLRVSSTSGKPIVIRVDSDSGHGIGSTRDQSFAERADVWAFFLSVFQIAQ
jgi:prolyl oligopeptidase